MLKHPLLRHYTYPISLQILANGIKLTCHISLLVGSATQL